MLTVEGQCIPVPLTRAKGLTEQTKTRMVESRTHEEFSSVADFYRRVLPKPEEMEAIIRVGGLDGFGKTRPALFWEAQHLYQAFGDPNEPGQGWLLPPLQLILSLVLRMEQPFGLTESLVFRLSCFPVWLSKE
jgi:DNA polymerase III alpha subunit